MATSYYNGKEVFNHIFKDKSHALAYANGKVVIDGAKREFAYAQITDCSSSGRLWMELDKRAASTVSVYVKVSYTANLVNTETNEAYLLKYKDTVQFGDIYRGNKIGNISLFYSIPSGYYFNGITYDSEPVITQIIPSSDALYDYVY